jgi:hypothetical protein
VSLATTRNVAIILALAAIVDLVPGGGTAASVVVTAVSLVFLGALGWIVAIMYREHRNELYSLGERKRVALYVSIGVLAVTLTATHRMWATALGSVAWLVFVAGAIYTGGAVLWSARRY